MVKFTVYGYYSIDDRYAPSFIDEFDTLGEAEQCVSEFEAANPGERLAWIEEY